MLKTDFLIIGAGIIRKTFPDKEIVILEKEPTCGLHASGRSGF